MGEVDKKYVRNMLLEYLFELVKNEKNNEAKYLVIAMDFLTDEIYERVFEPKDIFFVEDYEKNGEYSIAKIDWYEVGNYFNTNCITINKDGEFLTNIL